MKANNVVRDPSAPRLGISQLMRVRTYFDTLQTFVCSPCRYSEKSHIQVRCPNPACQRLMVRATS